MQAIANNVYFNALYLPNVIISSKDGSMSKVFEFMGDPIKAF
jgi:hypothetical protein